MKLRLAAISTGLAAMAGLVAWGLHVERARSEQALADLEACLFGERLGERDVPSERYRALALGEPGVRMRASFDADLRRVKFVPEVEVPMEQQWPARCSSFTLTLLGAPRHRGLSPELVTEASPLHEALSSSEPPPNLDAFWSLATREHPARPTGRALEPSWNPVSVVLHGSSDAFRQPCSVHGFASSEAGQPALRLGDCEVVEAGRLPLAGVRRVERDRSSRAQPPHVDRVGGFAIPGGRGTLRGEDLFWIHAGTLQHRRVEPAGELGAIHELSPAKRFETCWSGSRRHVLALPDDGLPTDGPGGALEATLVAIDAQGAPTSLPLRSEVPVFPGRHKTRVSRSRPRLNCSAEGARVAFAWSTWVDQDVLHQVELWRCDDRACSVRTHRVEVPTLQSSDCGFCDPQLEPASVVPLEVHDLGEVVLIAWSTPSDDRVRVAKLHELAAARDVVLVAPLESEPRKYSDRYSFAAGDTALLGLNRRGDTGPGEDLVFRVDARGVRALPAP